MRRCANRRPDSSVVRPPQPAVLQRQCACGESVSGIGTKCDECERGKSPALQADLVVGAGGDAHEREADRIADQASTAGSGSRNRPVSTLRTGPGPVATGAMPAPPSVHRTLERQGQPLESRSRSVLERKLGADFADVRVHHDDAAARSARDIHANAYTVGRDIVFAAGKYRPESHDGMHLLAHELTHVMQQSGSRAPAVQRDLAIEPQGVDKKERPLSEKDIKKAIRFNKGRIRDSKTLSEIRDVVGIDPQPAESDRDLALAVARWQMAHGVAQDGMLGPVTVMLLVEELQAESVLVPQLGTAAEKLKKEFSKKAFLDVDASFCGCKSALQDEIKTADRFIGHYTTCGADPANTTGDDIEACVKTRVPGAQVLASTSSTGAISIDCKRSGPCARLLCQIDLAHEQIHSVHTRELRQVHGGDTPAFDAAFNDAKDWVEDEVNSRKTDKSLSLWALQVLERTCP